MEQIIPQVWHIVLTAVLTAFGTYVTAIYNLKTRVAVLESRMKDIENDIAMEGEKIDKVTEVLFEIKQDIASIKAILNINDHK